MDNKPLSKEEQQRANGEATREAKNARGGRLLAKDADKALMVTQPWKAEGMSRASWYRRQKAKPK